MIVMINYNCHYCSNLGHKLIIRIEDFFYLPNFTVRVLLEGVKVSSNGSFKHSGILWNNAKPRSEIVKADLGYIYTIDYNASFSWFYYPKDGLYEG